MKPDLDFLIIGAQKAGTTSLFEYLRQHPQVYLPPGKETPYFSDDKIVARGWDVFIAQTFAYADRDLIWGTATPQYMAGTVLGADAPREEASESTVPERIHSQLPQVRLIAILRDPTDRALSHFRMMKMRGEEHRTFDEAIHDLLLPENLREARRAPTSTSAYVVWGEYGRILAGYWNLFGPQQLKIVFTADLEARPAEVLTGLHEYLGVRNDFLPENLERRYRVGAGKQRVGRFSPEAARSWARRNRRLRAGWNGLPECARHTIYTGFERVTYRFDLWNRKAADDDASAPSTETIQRLREHFEDDSPGLRALLDTAPPWLADGYGEPDTTAD